MLISWFSSAILENTNLCALWIVPLSCGSVCQRTISLVRVAFIIVQNERYIMLKFATVPL